VEIQLELNLALNAQAGVLLTGKDEITQPVEVADLHVLNDGRWLRNRSRLRRICRLGGTNYSEHCG